MIYTANVSATKSDGDYKIRNWEISIKRFL